MSYAEAAISLSVAAALFGLLYSVLDAVLKARRDGTAQWQPLPYAIGFALFWPALLLLFPLVIFDNVVAHAAGAERPWAVRLSATTWYRIAGRLAFGLGLGVMACYIAGFFF